MKEIGQFLKETRKKLNLTINDISDTTKMNINIIKNIEAGNIAYFDNDLTYLRYYVRSYANAVNVDFDSLVDQLEKSTLSHTQNMLVLEKEKLKQLNENIKIKTQNISNPLQHGGLKKPKSRIDWTLVSLISIIIVIGAFLIYSMFNNFLNKEPNLDKPPVVVDPNDDDKDPDSKDPSDDEDVIIADVEIIKENPSTYLISNWQIQEDFSIKTKFGVNTWVQIKVNNQVINIPDEKTSSKTYLVDQELILKDKYQIGDQAFDFKVGDTIVIRYGIMLGNSFYINGNQYDLDESIANASSGTDVIFKLDTDVD